MANGMRITAEVASGGVVVPRVGSCGIGEDPLRIQLDAAIVYSVVRAILRTSRSGSQNIHSCRQMLNQQTGICKKPSRVGGRSGVDLASGVGGRGGCSS